MDKAPWVGMKTVDREPAGAEAARITTVVADDSPCFVDCFCRHLRASQNSSIVGVAGTAFGAIDLVRSLNPQLVVMDLHMPGLRGDRAAAWIAEHYPDVHVVL